MARRALALVASLGLLIAVAVPAAASNINAQNLYSVHNLQSDVPGAARPPTPTSSTAGASSPARLRRGGYPTREQASRRCTTATPARSRACGDRARPARPASSSTASDRLQGRCRDRPRGRPVHLRHGRRPHRGLERRRDAGDQCGDDAGRGLPRPRDRQHGRRELPVRGELRGAHVDVFDKDYAPASLTGDFVDPGLPSGYAPFGIQNIGGEIFIAFAKQLTATRRSPARASATSAPSGPTARSMAGSRHRAISTPRGAWPRRRPRPSASSAAICSSATSATAASTRSSGPPRTAGRPTACSRARTIDRSRSTGCGASASAMARPRGRRTRCSSPPGRTTRRTASSGRSPRPRRRALAHRNSTPGAPRGRLASGTQARDRRVTELALSTRGVSAPSLLEPPPRHRARRRSADRACICRIKS